LKISQLAIRRPVTTSMFFIGIAILGIYAFNRLGVDLLPNVNIPHMMVQTGYPNANPEEVEKLITEPIESVIGTVPGVQKLTSVSREGISVISVDFVWGTDMNYSLLALREKLDNISYNLPRDAERPNIIRSDPSESPIMMLALTFRSNLNGKLPSENKQAYIDHDSNYDEIKRLIDLKEAGRVLFKRRFEQLEGVAQAIVTGGLEREILVEVNPVKMEGYGISFDQIEQSLKSSNINLPAGSIMKGLFRFSLRTQGEYKNSEEIKETVLKHNTNGSAIKLKDIAEVNENFKEREGLTRLNGAETVGFLIYKEPASNTVTISQRIKETIKSLEKEYPEYELVIVSDQSRFIENAISNVKQEILYGGILAVMVLIFFLGSLRNVFIIGITIPSSLVLTILLMFLFNINFNIISLGGIAVGIGMLLDNAIIVIENIVTYFEKGKGIRESAIKGSTEVSMPIIASTLTTIVVFLPLVFVKGIAGELFRDQSYAIAFSLISSIMTALTLIPMLASREKLTLVKNAEKYDANFIFLEYPINRNILYKAMFWLRFPIVFPIRTLLFISIKSGLIISRKMEVYFEKFYNVVNKKLEWVIEKYEIMLLWALDNKKKVVFLTLGLVIITTAAVIDIKKEFIPEMESDEFVVEIDYPNGTSLKGNASITSKIENAILKIPNVDNVISNIGRVNMFDMLNKNQISVDKTRLIIKIDSYENYYSVQSKLKKMFEKISGINYSFQPVKTTYSELINPSEEDIAIKIKDNDINTAFAKGEEVIQRLKNAKINGVFGYHFGVQKGTPEYTIEIDRNKCIEYGFKVQNVSNQLISLVKGNSTIHFSDFDNKVAINIRTAEKDRNEITGIISNYVTVDSLKIPISKLIKYRYSENFNQIWRENQARTLFVYAYVEDRSIDEAVKDIEDVLNKIPKLPGQMIMVGGVNEEIRNSFSGLYIALVISILLMYMILASEFESFLFPFIIIFSVPMGLIGGILSLYFAGLSISIISLMGLIILVGIADNDAVVKVEFILRKREEGLSVRDSIIQAGKDRFRPIVMNSLTVIFALIPMMFGIGAGTQLRISLSLAVAGGLVSSTFLTLVLIPVLYTYLEKLSNKKYNVN